MVTLAPGRFSVAPMLNWTDRHCRFFLRQLSRRALLYTEMVTTNALLFGKKDYLAYNEAEHPLALQLGGCEPTVLACCARMAAERGYDEINLNVGCPSYRVQKGSFGAYLMAEKKRVAECVAAMQEAVTLPVTVKTRIGIDEHDSYAFLCEFIDAVANQGGCKTVIIHARKACLNGLRSKKNREIPELDYNRVYNIKKDFPALTVILNGNIKTIGDAQDHLKCIDGVMMGREAYQNPGILRYIDSQIFCETDLITNLKLVIDAMLPYIEKELIRGTALNHITRHMLGLFKGIPGARQWRYYLSEKAKLHSAGPEVLINALAYINHLYGT